jgi:superfamily II DNA/RNA helicase
MSATKADKFSQLNLSKPLIESIREIGYEDPSPIQAETIPLLLEGKDVLGQAQTGTGKTAAFALPILSNLDFSQRNPQALGIDAHSRTCNSGCGGVSEICVKDSIIPCSPYLRGARLWRTNSRA